MTIVSGGAGRTKRNASQKATATIRTNGPSVSARSRQATFVILGILKGEISRILRGWALFCAGRRIGADHRCTTFGRLQADAAEGAAAVVVDQRVAGFFVVDAAAFE